MKSIISIATKILGIVFMVAAFLQWLTFNYPDVNPFWPGAIFAVGMISQVLNWLIVCVLATVGWGFFTHGKFKFEKSGNRPSVK